ncbi:MAG: hypothetical protein OEV71_05950 [Nitrospira sp.]|nr:hypothetical protein [Nitrospira sp.]MDH5335031.1 hypothetical protein [Nitrospira sp.]
MSPGPGLIEVGQVFQSAGDRRQGPLRIGLERGPFLGDDDQADPRSQASRAVGRRRGEEPGEIGPVEFDGRKVIRLEVGHVGMGLCANDLACVQAGDVTGAMELHIDIDGRTLVHPETDGQYEAARRGRAGNSGTGEAREESSAKPGVEAIGGCGLFRHGVSSQLNYVMSAVARRRFRAGAWPAAPKGATRANTAAEST